MGLSFNMVTSMCVVLAVGITVGYSVHIAHNFLTQTGTNKERATAALRDIGGEVLCGAVTSWLAIMGLVFTQTYTMQVCKGINICYVMLYNHAKGPCQRQREWKQYEHHLGKVMCPVAIVMQESTVHY